MALQGLNILLAYPEGLLDGKQQAAYNEARKQAHSLATLLGACIVDGLDEAEVLITESVLTRAYLQNAGSSSPKPVLKSEWLHECRNAKKQVPFEHFRLEPLAGLKVSITGFTEPRHRIGIPEQVHKAGALYTPDLHKDATHLVALYAGGSKYKYAAQWGIRIVSEQWVNDCVARGMRLDEAKYAPPKEPPRNAGSAQPTARATATAAGPTGPNPQPSAVLATSGAVRTQAAAGALAAPLTSAKTLPDAPRLGTEELPSSRRPDPARQRSVASQPRCNNECLFLDGVRVHCVGLSEADMVEVRQLAAEGGALRFMDLVPRVTHVIVGQEPAGDALQALRDHMAEWREHVRVVRLQWLRDAVAARACIEPSAEQSFTVAQLMPQKSMALGSSLTSAPSQPQRLGLGRAASGALGAAASVPLAPQPGAMSFADLAGEASRSMLPPDLGWGGDTNMGSDGLLEERALDVVRPLAGMWFTTVAFGQEEAERGEAARAEELIRAKGGLLFTAGTFKNMSNADPSCILAICPHGLPQHRVQDLERSCPDFKRVHPDNRVTLFWLEDSLAKGKRLATPNRLQPGYTPLPLTLPLGCMQGLRFSSKKLKPASVEGIKKLVGILGAEYSDSITKANTHIIMNTYIEEVYKTLLKWGCIVVKPPYLLELAATGRLPNPWEARFRPEGEPAEKLGCMKEQVAARVDGRLHLAATQTQQISLTQQPQPQAAPAPPPPQRTRPLVAPQPAASLTLQPTQALLQPAAAATPPLQPQPQVKDRAVVFSSETGFAVGKALSPAVPLQPVVGVAAAGSGAATSSLCTGVPATSSGPPPTSKTASAFAAPAAPAQGPHVQPPAPAAPSPAAAQDIVPIGSAEAMPPPRMKLQMPQMPGAATNGARNNSSGHGSSGTGGSGRGLLGSTGTRGAGSGGAGGDENAPAAGPGSGSVAAAAAPSFPAPGPLAPRAGNGTGRKTPGKSPKVSTGPSKVRSTSTAADISAPGGSEVGSRGAHTGGRGGDGADVQRERQTSGEGHQESTVGPQAAAPQAATAAEEGREEEGGEVEDGSAELDGLHTLLRQHQQQQRRQRPWLDGSASQLPAAPPTMPQLHVHATSMAISGRDTSRNTSGNSRGTTQLEGDVTSAKMRKAPKRAQPGPPGGAAPAPRKSARIVTKRSAVEEEDAGPAVPASQQVDYDMAPMQPRGRKGRGATGARGGGGVGSDAQVAANVKHELLQAVKGSRGSGRSIGGGPGQKDAEPKDMLDELLGVS